MQNYGKTLSIYGAVFAVPLLSASILTQGLATGKSVTDRSPDPWRTAVFEDQNGDPYSFRDDGGSPIIVSFAFTGCSMYCPAQAIELAFLQEELNATIGEDAYRIVSVSLTPVYDRPADMKRFADRFQVDFGNWRFLTGSEAGTESLIESTGIDVTRYTGGTRPDLDHTTDVYLLDGDGQIVDRIAGIPLDEEHLKSSLFELLEADPGSAAS